MARKLDFDIRCDADLALVEAIDPPELALRLVVPEIAPRPSAAGRAYARHGLGLLEALDPRLCDACGIGGPDPSRTRH